MEMSQNQRFAFTAVILVVATLIAIRVVPNIDREIYFHDRNVILANNSATEVGDDDHIKSDAVFMAFFSSSSPFVLISLEGDVLTAEGYGEVKKVQNGFLENGKYAVSFPLVGEWVLDSDGKVQLSNPSLSSERVTIHSKYRVR
jgi:hypothetical protein